MKYNRIILEIAKLPVSIDVNDSVLNEFIIKECQGFLSRKKPILNVKAKFNPGFKVLPCRGKFIPLKIYNDKGVLTCKSWNFEGKIDISKKKANLEIGEKGMFSSLQNFLRVLYAAILVENKGVMIHSASIIKDTKGYLFLGKSGSGKTTVSESAYNKKYKVLSDDVTIIRKEGKSYKVYNSPFWGALTSEIADTNELAKPIAGLFKLIKSDKNK